jgi:hypothetical protein
VPGLLAKRENRNSANVKDDRAAMAAVKMPRAMTIKFSAEVDGNSMSGMAKITNLGAFGKIPFTGKLI